MSKDDDDKTVAETLAAADERERAQRAADIRAKDRMTARLREVAADNSVGPPRALATQTYTANPFDRLQVACYQAYSDERMIACLFVMSHATQRAFVRHWPSVLPAPQYGSTLVELPEPIKGSAVPVDSDDTLTFGLVRARFDRGHDMLLDKYGWREFTVMSTGER